MLIPCLRNSFIGLAASRRYQRLRYNIFRHIAEQGRHFAREHADRPDQSPLPPSASINQHAGSRQSSLPQSILYVSQEWRTPQSPRDLESTCCLECRRDTSRWGDPPTEVDCVARRKQPARPLHVISHLHPQATPQPPTPGQPSPIPNSAQTHANSIRPRNKQLLGEQSQTRRHKPPSNHEPAFVTSLGTATAYHTLKTTKTRLQPAVFRLYCNR